MIVVVHTYIYLYMCLIHVAYLGVHTHKQEQRRAERPGTRESEPLLAEHESCSSDLDGHSDDPSEWAPLGDAEDAGWPLECIRNIYIYIGL